MTIHPIRAVVAGALAGTAATAVMSVVMFGGKAAGLLQPMPPEEITAEMLERAGVREEAGEAGTDVLAAFAHFGFGAAAGAAYAPFAHRLPGPRALAAAAYATGVWAVSYLGWAPALHLVPPAHRDLRRNAVMLPAHWVFGAVLGLLVRAAQPAFTARRVSVPEGVERLERLDDRARDAIERATDN
jgi:hypothetical protein